MRIEKLVPVPDGFHHAMYRFAHGDDVIHDQYGHLFQIDHNWFPMMAVAD
jgi:hypothetical protein